MKKNFLQARLAGVPLLLLLTLLVAFSIPPPAWAGKGKVPSSAVLSGTEATMLSYMREEEKLARDVYLYLDPLWGTGIFATIAKSEQQHMDTMKKKLDQYGLPDPALATYGAFTDPGLQAKYDALVARGELSYRDGLAVGATIEEIDMVDIQYAIDVTSHLDLVTAYQNLLEGSRNHLRAFVGALASQGVVYTPQFISQELFDAIINL